MGEYSRFKGELGENIAEGFFDLIGWSYVSNFDTDCVNRHKHNRRKHGIDYFSGYLSPLESGIVDTVITSVKYLESVSKEELKEEISNLDENAICIQASTVYDDLITSIYHRGRKNHLLLFCLISKSDSKLNLIESMKSVLDEITLNANDITLIDNDRINFIYSSVTYAKSLYSNSDPEFFYSPTGINEEIERGLILSGKTLPIELLSSNIIAFKVIEKETKVLIICIKENFEKSSFKRVVGLSQRLTLGWCNKIHICYPDYQLLKHRTVKQSVLMSFADSDFVNMIELKNYNDSYISFEENGNIESKISPIQEKSFNIDTMLPSGDMLRQLLVESFIGKQEISQLLQKRGVFVNKSFGKHELIPYLSKSLLSPNEFEFLKRKQALAAKDPSEKITTNYLTRNVINEVETAMTASRQKVKQILLSKYPNYQITNDLPISINKNGDISVKYSLNTRDLSKDWTKIESTQKGEIIFSSKPNNEDTFKTQIDIISDSKASANVGKAIQKEIISQLKKLGSVTAGDKVQKITVNEFSRPMRNNFLLSFIQNIPIDSNMEFCQLKYIDFSIDDDTEVFSDELMSLKNRLEESKFTGRKLEEITFVTDKKYRESIIFYAFIAEYSFKSLLNNELIEGKVEIEFGFPDMKGKSIDSINKGEFEFKIKNLTPFLNRTLNDREMHDLKLMTKMGFDLIKDQNLNKYLSAVQLNIFP